MARKVAPKTKRLGKWERALLQHLLEREAVEPPQRYTKWSPALRALNPSRERSVDSALARALTSLELAHLVTVDPPDTPDTRRVPRVYRFTPSGRRRAEELKAHGGLTAAGALRAAKEKRTKRRAAAIANKKRQQVTIYRQFANGTKQLEAQYEVPTGEERLRFMSQRRDALQVEINELLDSEELEDLDRQSLPAPVLKLLRLLAEHRGLVWQLSTRKQHETEARRVWRRNDRLWPDLRTNLIASGVEIAPDAGWREVRRNRKLWAMVSPPLGDYDFPFGSLAFQVHSDLQEE